MNFLYTDGGIIGRNPSSVGGTWAWCHVQQDQMAAHDSGVFTPKNVYSLSCTNNQAELIAVLKGLNSLSEDWIGTVASDSQITLGRVFWQWKTSGIPDYLVAKLQELKEHFICWDRITPLLLEGHPTAAELQKGYGKSGRPVDKFNVWCDEECSRVGQEYLQSKGS